MRTGVMLLAAAGCVVVALLFGKRPDNDWGSAVMAVLFAGTAGALLMVAAG